MAQNDHTDFPELSSIIWRAIKDCADAQREAAITTRDLILGDILFESNGKNGPGRDLRMLSFSYLSDGEQHQIKMPLSSVVPAQFIQIKEVDIDFNIYLKSVEKGLKVSIARRPLIRRLTGTSPTQTSHAKETSISINIKGRNTGMSSGMARLLQLATGMGTYIKPLG